MQPRGVLHGTFTPSNRYTPPGFKVILTVPHGFSGISQDAEEAIRKYSTVDSTGEKDETVRADEEADDKPCEGEDKDDPSRSPTKRRRKTLRLLKGPT